MGKNKAVLCLCGLLYIILVSGVTPALVGYSLDVRGYIGFGGEWVPLLSIGTVAFLIGSEVINATWRNEK